MFGRHVGGHHVAWEKVRRLGFLGRDFGKEDVAMRVEIDAPFFFLTVVHLVEGE